jgi:DNA-binding Xre family transcriptional regulator
MLKFNFKPMFDARGIDKPVGYLRKLGVSPYTASYIKHNKVKTLSLDVVERICLWLNCTPHDLLEWVPDAKVTKPEKYELNKLRREKQIMVVAEELRELPLEKLERVHRFIEETKREGS